MEGEPLQDVVGELDGGALVEAWVDAQDPEPGAVVDGGELVVLAGLGAGDGGDEFDVDPQRTIACQNRRNDSDGDLVMIDYSGHLVVLADGPVA